MTFESISYVFQMYFTVPISRLEDNANEMKLEIRQTLREIEKSK